MVRITESLLDAGRSDRGGLNKNQLAVLGIDWPPAKGWKRQLIGMEIPDEAADSFLALRKTSNTKQRVPPSRPKKTCEVLTCRECSAEFTVSKANAKKYPNWRPETCPKCHRSTNSTTRSAAVEENLTLAEVLKKHSGGPQTGVFTDGSASPNPGPGGWGVVWVEDGEIRDQAHGQSPDTTNNRMELQALIAAYEMLPPSASVQVFTDSKLCVNSITIWAHAWEKNGWTRGKKGKASR